jgi:hypothetical protein
VTAAFSDDSQSFTEAIKAVYPHARFQADHCHTVKNSWGHLKKALVSYRRQIKARGEAQHDQDGVELAKTWWKWRWSLLKKPANFSAEAKQAIRIGKIKHIFFSVSRVPSGVGCMAGYETGTSTTTPGCMVVSTGRT